jgi:integrase
MATIRKRGNSYQIRVSCGYNTNGNQVERSMTWKPDAKMTPKQIEKELNRQAVMFEEACMNGKLVSSVKFEEFAEQWFKEYAEIKLKAQTIRNYRYLSERTYKAIGHIRMDKITTRTIQLFITQLTETPKTNQHGDKIEYLSPKSIKNYVSFISSVFDYAVKQQLVNANPCRNVTLPRVIQKDKNVYTLDEIQKILQWLDEEKTDYFHFVMFFKIAIFTGLRRGELLGLEWKDFNFDNCLMQVRRNSLWTKEKGIYTDTPKTKGSIRMLKMPLELVNQLLEYKEHQEIYKASLGNKWIECDRLFTKADGSPMSVRAPRRFLENFCKNHNIRYCNIHSFRHFNASMLINSGVDVKTVQACLGHNGANTTLNIYSHPFQEAQAIAMTSVADCILKKNSSEIT